MIWYDAVINYININININIISISHQIIMNRIKRNTTIISLTVIRKYIDTKRKMGCKKK